MISKRHVGCLILQNHVVSVIVAKEWFEASDLLCTIICD